MQKEVEIQWQGKPYIVPISMALINRIENANVNLMLLAVDLAAGGIPKTSLVATMYAILLQAGGCAVTNEEVWTAMTKGDAVKISKFANAALNAFFPEVENDDEESETKKG